MLEPEAPVLKRSVADSIRVGDKLSVYVTVNNAAEQVCGRVRRLRKAMQALVFPYTSR